MTGLMALNSARGQAIYATPYTIITIAGTMGEEGDTGGMNGAGLFGFPSGVTVDASDNVYVVDDLYNLVRKVAPDGGTNWLVSTIATGLDEPNSVAMDSSGNLYVVCDATLRELTPNGGGWTMTTIAGAPGNNGPSDGTNSAAQFDDPSGIAVDAAGNLYIADTDNQDIRRVVHSGTNWIVTTIAGTAEDNGSSDGTNGGAQFYFPSGIAVDAYTNLFVADGGNNTIRKITPMGTNWVVTTIAGTASVGGGALIDGTNGDASFNAPGNLTVDANDNLYVADGGDNAIRRVSPSGTNWVVTTLAGDPNGNIGTNNGTGPTAQFFDPLGIALDKSGTLFVGDTANSTIREGFVAALPNPTIAVAGANVVVSWAGSFGTLQTNANLATPNWGVYGGQVNSSNGTNSVTISPGTGNLFFRIAQ